MARKKTTTPAQEPETATTAAQEAQEQPQEAAAAQEAQQPTPEAEAAKEAQEAPQEGHLDPGQLAAWDDAALRKLAQDMGLDPAAYADRDAMIATITAVPVTPAPAEAEPKPIDADTPFPCRATVTAALAVLRRTIGPGTAEMLKPVATLKRGTEITVTTYKAGHVQLANGLWTNASCLAQNPT